VNPRMALAKMCRSAKAAEFSPADVAAAVGCVRHPAAARLVLWLWADQRDLGPAVAGDLARWADARIRRYRLNLELAAAAMVEFKSPKRCSGCGGLGLDAGSPAGDVCKKCYGTGTVAVAESARAHSVGLHHTSWHHCAGPIYDAMLGRLGQLEGLALGRVRRALLREEPCSNS
jgi:hypothetical protein